MENEFLFDAPDFQEASSWHNDIEFLSKTMLEDEEHVHNEYIDKTVEPPKFFQTTNGSLNEMMLNEYIRLENAQPIEYLVQPTLVNTQSNEN